ncbi:MAG: tetratricopeptide repeat protein, partial [Pseudomonadota bacterium]
MVVLCVGQVPAAAQKSDDLAALNQKVAQLYRAGKYAAATEIAKRALTVAEAKFGPDHPNVGTTLNNLAALYRAQGRYAEAEPLYKRSLSIREKALGPDHPHVGTTLNNLAGLYLEQGRYAEAEPLYRRSLSIRQKALGLDHPSVGTTLNNLAGLYESQGRYAEAEPLYKRTIMIFEKALGPDHPDVGTTLNNLAGLYRAQGRYSEAEPLYERALSIREKGLGPDHPNVGTTLNNLALLYRAQGRFAEAEPLYKRDLAIGEKALGPDHPRVGTTLNNLATLYKQLGRTDDEAKIRARIARMPPAGTQHLPVYFATTRSRSKQAPSPNARTTPALFGTKPATALSFGRVVMQVPAEVIKRLGEDRAANLRLDRGRAKLTAADVFKRVRHRHLTRRTFTGSLRARLGRSALSKNQALIFVHGFNVDFDEAVKRLSQVAFDLEFDGALVAFSWPSLGSSVRYLGDRRRADASVDQLIAFLDQVSADLPDVTFHVMAHSMGNRILTRALHKIARRPKDAKRQKLGEIILA